MAQDTLSTTGINGVSLPLPTLAVWYEVKTNWTKFVLFNKTGGTVHFRQTEPTIAATDDTTELPLGSTTPLVIPSGSTSFFLRADVGSSVVKITPSVS